MIKRSQVAAARLAVAAAKYQGKEHELSETTKRLAKLKIDSLPRGDAGSSKLIKRAALRRSPGSSLIRETQDFGSSFRLVQDHLDSEPVVLPDGSKEFRIFIAGPLNLRSHPADSDFKGLVKDFERKSDRLSKQGVTSPIRLVLVDRDGVAHAMWNRGDELTVEERNRKFASHNGGTGFAGWEEEHL